MFCETFHSSVKVKHNFYLSHYLSYIAPHFCCVHVLHFSSSCFSAHLFSFTAWQRESLFSSMISSGSAPWPLCHAVNGSFLYEACDDFIEQFTHKGTREHKHPHTHTHLFTIYMRARCHGICPSQPAITLTFRCVLKIPGLQSCWAVLEQVISIPAKNKSRFHGDWNATKVYSYHIYKPSW